MNNKALYITTQGIETVISPRNGKTFTLKELQKYVGGYIETVPTTDNKIMVLNEEGKLKELPINRIASKRYKYHWDDIIVGNVVICDKNLIE